MSGAYLCSTARSRVVWAHGSGNVDACCAGMRDSLTWPLGFGSPSRPHCTGTMLRSDADERVADLGEQIEILFIIDYFHRTGGTEKHLAQLVAGLPAAEFRCSVVVFDLGANPLLDGLRARGVPIISLPVTREYVPNALVQGWRLSRLIRRNRYKIIQTMHQKSDSYGAIIARMSGCRHIVSSKRDTGELRKAWHIFINRRLWSLFERCIVVANAVGSAVTASVGLPANRVVTIYNGVDISRFRVPGADERRQAGSDSALLMRAILWSVWSLGFGQRRIMKCFSRR